MESRRQIAARSMTSTFPDDLIVEILSRLPTKSIGRFRSVSKSWASMIRGKEFTDSFFTRSCSRPQLLFACCNSEDREVHFFSTPQPHNLDENPSPVAATFHMKVAFNQIPYVLCAIGGLVGFRDSQILGKKTKQVVTIVCNPSTGQSFKLPKMKTNKRVNLHSFLGYDPIGNEVKVLSMTDQYVISEEHQVLTLRTEESSWRMIECGKPHFPSHETVCINGILYYGASAKGRSKISMIACFDVRTETYLRFIELTQVATSLLNGSEILVNYKGSLALLAAEGSDFNIDEKCTSFVMCVYSETHDQWSKRIFELPPEWLNVVGLCPLSFVGLTAANEIVLSPYFPSDLFYVIYYNFDRNTIRRVAIQGMEAAKVDNVQTFLNHVENVKLYASA